MKKQFDFSHGKTQRFLSMLLVMLFLSISISQMLHTHKVFASEKENLTTDSVSAVEKCEICDFIIHKQSKHIPAYIVEQLIERSPAEVSYNCNSCICNYEFTLQGFTNKGPPIQYS